MFSKADRPFRTGGLPLLTGMALTFAALALVATIGGGWTGQANQYGRLFAMIVLAVFGLTLVWEGLATRLSSPLVRLGSRMASAEARDRNPSVLQSLLLGVATGLLWAPCAGPILGLVLTGAAVGGASGHTLLLLMAYSAGAVVSLAPALLAGRRVFSTLKKSLGAEIWIRRVLGTAVLTGLAMIALGLDRGLLTRLSLASKSGVEQSLVDRLEPKKEEPAMMMMSATAPTKTGIPETLPDLGGAKQWLNTAPECRRAQRARGADRFLDLLLHQLSENTAVHPELESSLQTVASSSLAFIPPSSPSKRTRITCAARSRN